MSIKIALIRQRMSSLIAKFTVVIQHENKQCPFGFQQPCSSAHSLPTLTLLQWHYRGFIRARKSRIPSGTEKTDRNAVPREALRGAGTAWAQLARPPGVPRAGQPPLPLWLRHREPTPPRRARSAGTPGASSLQGTWGGNTEGEGALRKLWKQAPKTERAQELRISCSCKAWK